MTNAPDSQGFRRIRVLVVASETAAAQMSAEMSRGSLETTLVRVETLHALTSALESERFDVVLCDDGLPALGGPDTLRRIKAARPELPVIVVSSMFGESVAAAAMKAGADDFIAQGYLARLVPAVEREIRSGEARENRQRVDEALRASEELYRDLMEHSHVLISVHDLEGRFLTANSATKENLGWDPAAAIPSGVRIQDVLAPESLESFPRYLAEVRERGVSRGLMTMLTRAGQKKYWEYRNTLRTEGVDVPVVRGVAFDVTDRVRAEQDLREARQFLERAQEVAQIGSWTSGVGEDDSAVWSRETCRIFGVDPETFAGNLEAFFARVHPADLDAVLRAGRDAIAQDLPYRLEHRIVRPDGTVRWVYERGDVIRDVEGVARRMVGIVQDITERRQLEEQFLQSQKMEAIGRLAGGVAHDFNNLLTAILGYTDLLLAQVSPGDPMRGDLEEISRAGERAASLTRQLLAFSRRQMLEPKLLDVNSIVTDLQKMLRRLIGEDILLVTRLDPEIDVVRADPGQLEQVLVNLAVNSRDAMPSGGTITIATQTVDFRSASEIGSFAIAPGRYVRIDFQDTGAGMETATLARIFEPFFTTKEKGKGTGLGLATAYGIIKQSGGYIACDSDIGRGTRFQIYLPRSLERPEAEPENGRSRAPLRGSETVLLVEDEEGVRRLARKLLETHGYEVLEASSGEQAIELATRFPGVIHLVLTDIVMPGMDGPEAAARIRTLRPEIRVLFMSGYTDALPDRISPESALIQKPFTPQTLAKRVREALAG